MTGRALFDAFSKKVGKDATPNAFPSLPVSMFAISPQPDDYRELRCLITERELSPGENVLTCSSEFTNTGVDATPDNVTLTLRANGTFSNEVEKVAVWLSKARFTDVCNCDLQQTGRPEGDKEVSCNVAQTTGTSDPSFILSKIGEEDIKQLSSLRASDVEHLYRLYTNEGNMCRLIDHRGYVTCIMDSNETANPQQGTYFKVVTR